MLVLDISCQHLGDECKLESFCATFGRKVGECTFLEYVSVEYIQGVFFNWSPPKKLKYLKPRLGESTLT